ncbi:MAG: DUF1704 domain-containing protein [Nanoarchaeota archaeon]|nr:DUF1704 domain-containing protein [Nanoarchaeota archaeon]
MLLKKVDRDLGIITTKIGNSYFNPTNANEQKEKLFKDNTNNPKFTYLPQKDLTNIENKLLSLKANNSVYGQLLKKKIKEMHNLITMIKNVGKKEFTKYSLRIYGKPSSELIKEARRILKIDEEEVWNKYSKLSMNKKFMDQFNINNYKWNVREKEMVAGAAISTKYNTLMINKGKDFSENDVKRLIVHEIGTHVTRFENAKKQKYKMFRFGFPGYLETEEGLAAYNEYRCGLLSPKILRNYAGRVLANHMSLSSSFCSVYNDLLDYFPKNDAWTLTLRSKRGMIDTSKPGGFTKDHLYLKGFLKVKQFAESGGDMKKLYVGKIGIEHVPLLDYI